MGKCVICNIDNPELTSDLANSALSSRTIAEKWQVFGKTTVNKHRKHSGIAPKRPQKTDTDTLEVIWNGNTGELHTGSLETDLSGMSHEEVLRMFGHDPEKVEIKDVLRERHSQYWSRDLDKMLWKHSYAYALVRKNNADVIDIDPVKLLAELNLKSEPRHNLSSKEPKSTFVLDWADWQVHKKEGGGAAGFIERFDSALDAAVARIVELRTIGRRLNELVIIGGGDIIEGCTIYPQQSFGIDGNRREQIRTAVSSILTGLHRLAPYFQSVRVVVVPGNHGENRINGYRTELGDNDDLLVFEMAQTALAHDPNMKHVSFEIAEREVSITTEIQGWTYGITHGDVYGKGSGTGIRNKVFNWFKTMAANRHAVGASDVLVTHHFHHDALEDWGATLWVQNPTMDGGSHYFVEATGHKPKHGMNSWVVTPAERFQDKQVLR